MDIFRAQFSLEAEGVRHLVTNVWAKRLDDDRIQTQANIEAEILQPTETRRLGSYQDIWCEWTTI